MFPVPGYLQYVIVGCYMAYIYAVITSSTAQGGGGGIFKDRTV